MKQLTCALEVCNLAARSEFDISTSATLCIMLLSCEEAAEACEHVSRYVWPHSTQQIVLPPDHPLIKNVHQCDTAALNPLKDA